MGLFKKKDEPEMVEREDGLIDYDVYIMSKEEKIINIINKRTVPKLSLDTVP